MSIRRDYLIFDGTNLTHRAYHALAFGGREVDRHEVVANVRAMVSRWRHQLGHGISRSVLAAFDAGDSGRKAIDPEYKAGRGERPPELRAALELAPLALHKAGIAVHNPHGYEADDVIATLAAQARAGGDTARIVSSDRDLLQTIDGKIGEGVTVHLLLSKAGQHKIYDAPAFWHDWTFPHTVLPLYNAIVGEKGDNIAGVPGIGPAWGAKLVAHFSLEPDPLATMLNPSPREDRFPPQRIANLLDGQEERIRRNLQLTTLRTDVPGVAL